MYRSMARQRPISGLASIGVIALWLDRPCSNNVSHTYVSLDTDNVDTKTELQANYKNPAWIASFNKNSRMYDKRHVVDTSKSSETCVFRVYDSFDADNDEADSNDDDGND